MMHGLDIYTYIRLHNRKKERIKEKKSFCFLSKHSMANIVLEKKVWMRCLRRPSLFWTYKTNTYFEMYTYAPYIPCEVFGLSFLFAMHNASHRRLCLLHLSIVKIENSASFFFLSRDSFFFCHVFVMIAVIASCETGFVFACCLVTSC